MIHRRVEAAIRTALRGFPVVALLGPRQVGKTTLVRQVVEAWGRLLALDGYCR